MLNYPIKTENIDQLYKKIELNNTSGYYPVGKNNKWHSGIHFETNSPIKVINNGNIVAYRISKDFIKKKKIAEISEDTYHNLTKNEQECYETKENNVGHAIIKTYKLKDDLSEDQKNLLYSNSFVLIKNEINSSDLEESIPIYSLYMNLLPDSKNPLSEKESFSEISKELINKKPFYRRWIFKVKDNYTGIKAYHKLCINGATNIYEGSTFISNYKTEVNLKNIKGLTYLFCCRFNYTGSVIKLPTQIVKFKSISFTIKNKESRKVYKSEKNNYIGYCKENTNFTVIGDECEKIFSYNGGDCYISINIGSNDIEGYTPINCWIPKVLLTKDCYSQVWSDKTSKIYSLLRTVSENEKPIVLNESIKPVQLYFNNTPTTINASKYDAFKTRNVECDKSMDAYIPVETYLQESPKPKRLNLCNAEIEITEIIGEIKYNTSNANFFSKEYGLMKYWLHKNSEFGEPVGFLKPSEDFIFEDGENDIIQDKIISSAIINQNDKKFKINIEESPSKIFLAKSEIDKNILDKIQNCDIPVTEDDIIGFPGTNSLGNKNYFDFVVILEKSLFDYKQKKSDDKKYLIDIPEDIKFYKRQKKQIERKNQFFPSGTSYQVIQSETFADESVKKIKINKIAIWVRNTDIKKNQKDHTCKIINPLSGYWLITTYGNYTRTDLQTNSKTEWLTNEMDSLRNEFIKDENTFTILNTNDGNETLIEIDFSKYSKKLEFWVKDVSFFSQDEGKTAESKTISFYLENPICKTVEEISTSNSFENITKIGEPICFSNSLELCNLVGTEFYIKKDDVDKCQHEAFDWNYYFTEITENACEKENKGTQSDIFCNRSEVISQIDVDNEQNDIPGWQYRIKDNQITQAELDQVYQDNEVSNKIRLGLRKLVCKHPLEWNKKIYENIKDDYEKATGCQLQNEQELKDEADATDIWDGLKILNNLADTNGCLWFVHPVYFFNHMDRVGAFGFNPYEKKTITPRFADASDPDIVVSSCPGFAPAVKDNSNDKVRFPDSFKKRLNNVDLYWAAVNYDYGNTNGYGGNHTGIDLAGTEGTPIYALVEGVVWATTFSNTVENQPKTGSYGRCMIIKGTNDKLYILGHLNKFNKEVGQKIYIGDIVAEVGNTGNSFGAHLHIEVLNCNKDIKDLVLNKESNKKHKKDGGDGINQNDGLIWNKNFTRERLHPLKQ